jgi:hypothetical protein
MRAKLQREVEGVLHLRRAEHDLAIADDEEATVADIGDEEGRVMEQCEEAGGRAVNALERDISIDVKPNRVDPRSPLAGRRRDTFQTLSA